MERLFKAVLLLVFLGACNTQSIPAALQATLVQYGGFVLDAYDHNAATIAPQVEAQGYNITSYLYSSAEADPDVFIGFIGVSTSRNDVAVVLRGTVTVTEWLGNAMVTQTPFPYLNGSAGPKVHSGFLDLYTTTFGGRKSLRQQIVAGLEQVYDKHSITLVGHSLGGALAILCAFDISNRNLNITSDQMQVYTFASPMVGGDSFGELSQGLNLLRVADIRDLVPYLPSRAFQYIHTGTQVSVDGCNFQKSTASGVVSKVEEYHSMGRYLHTVSSLSRSLIKASATSRVEASLFFKSSDILKFLKTFVSSKDFPRLVINLVDFLANFDKSCGN